MSFNFSELQQKANRVIHNADESVRKLTKLATDTSPVQIEIYDQNGNLNTFSVETIPMQKQKVDNYIENARYEYPAINILNNPGMLDIDGDGQYDCPLPLYTSGDYSIVEKTVFSALDANLPQVVKDMLYGIGAIYNDSNGNPVRGDKVPFNVLKIVLSGSSYTSGGSLLIPYNAVRGKYSIGFLGAVSTTGNIKVEGVGELTPNQTYKYVVCRSGDNRNHNIDGLSVNVNGTADLWIVGPWITAGKFLEVGVDKGHPLFTHGSIYKI